MKKAGLGGFLLAIIGVIILAWIKPSIGVSQNPISLERIAVYGVSFIFFFYGLSLDPQQLKAGLSNWKMHVVVQVTTFVVFPMIAIVFRPLFVDTSVQLLWFGAYYLSSLPSTVSSSVVMVSIAGGNLPAAIFNASISSLIGIFATPFWMGLFAETEIGLLDPWSVITKLTLQVLVPVGLGIILHNRFGKWVSKYKSKLKIFDQSVIVLIIYTSFCQSFYNHVFDDLGAIQLLGLSIAMIALFLGVFAFINVLSRLLHFNREDRITILFCGSKKSLVHGTVMSKVLFQQSTTTGLILLPLMLYHAMQLIIASIIAQRMNNKQQE
jgi:solute carrier family 10 (sodium/bile acid cotransporter), member 7